MIGYEISLILSLPTAQWIMEVGSFHTSPPDGADVFATTSGVGTSTKSGFFPAGIGIPQRGNADAHFDIYAACETGQFQALVSIYYTTP